MVENGVRQAGRGGPSATARASGRAAAGIVTVIGAVCGGSMLVTGFWSLLAPASFAAWIDFPPYNEHLLHDLGAFQLGIGVMVLAALVWSDARAVTLLGFVVAGTVHAVNHGTDLHLGGRGSDRWLLGILALLALVGLVLHLRAGRRTGGPRGQQP